MYLKFKHNTDKETAIKKIDGFLGELVKKEFPGGFVIKNPIKEWSGSIMNFSFEVKRRIFVLKIGGVVVVTDQNVTVSCNIPGITKRLTKGNDIEDILTKQIRGFFV